MILVIQYFILKLIFMSMKQLYIILVSLWHFYTCMWHTLIVPPLYSRLLVQYNSFIAKSFTPDGNTSAIESPVSQVCPVDSKTPRIRWEEARSAGVFSGWPTSLDRIVSSYIHLSEKNAALLSFLVGNIPLCAHAHFPSPFLCCWVPGMVLQQLLGVTQQWAGMGRCLCDVWTWSLG